jgi:hypothetical protein
LWRICPRNSEEEEKMIKLELPETLLKAARETAQAKGFGSVEEYLLSILQRELAMGADESVSVEEKEKIKERLRQLGYLD